MHTKIMSVKCAYNDAHAQLSGDFEKRAEIIIKKKIQSNRSMAALCCRWGEGARRKLDVFLN